jgi:hypothetical protein
MNCREFLDLLQQRLDGAGVPYDSAQAEHARECSLCSARVRASRRLMDGLNLLAPPVPAPDLAPRIASAARAALRRQRLIRRTAFVAAAAAVVLIVIGVGRFLPLVRNDNSGQARLSTAPAYAAAGAAQESPIQPKPALRSAVAEAGEAVASLTSRTADEALDNTRILLPMVSGPEIAGFDLPADPTARPLREAGQNISEGLGPVARSARRAVDLFIREFPPVSAREPKGS